MVVKQSKIWSLNAAADQVGIAALGISAFVTAVEPVSPSGPVGAGAMAGPDLVADPDSASRLVTHTVGREATMRFWQLLVDPATYGR